MKDRKKREKLIQDYYLNNPKSKSAMTVYLHQEAHLSLLASKAINTSYFSAFESIYHDLTESIINLNTIDKSEWKDYHYKFAVLYSKIPKCIFGSYYLSIQGYYFTSISATRTPYEILLRILYSCKHIDQIDETMMCKGKFQASNVLPHQYKIYDEESNSKDLDYLYSLMSKPLHSMLPLVVKDMLQYSKTGSVDLKLNYDFNIDHFVVSQNILLAVIYMVAKTYTTIFKDVSPNYTPVNYISLKYILKTVKMDWVLKNTASISDQITSCLK